MARTTFQRGLPEWKSFFGALPAGCVAVFAGFFAAAQVARADIRGPGTANSGVAVPHPAPVTVSVIRGRTVVIPMRAATAVNRRVEFLTRSEPAHGELGEIVPDPQVNTAASVVYTCRAARGITEDRFRFAARFSGGRISGPAEAVIRIVDAVPRLEMPEALGFGDVMLGETGKAVLTIRNTGTAPLDTPLRLPAPWLGPDRISVAEGATIEVPLFFRPATPGGHHGDLVLLEGPGGKVELKGDALAPFVIQGGGLELSWNPKKRRREGVVRLQNLKEEVQTIRVSGGPRLRVDGEKILRGRAEADLEVWIPVEDAASFGGELVFESGGYRAGVAVAAEPVPALLEWGRPLEKEFHFGFVPQGVERRHTFELRNLGGEPEQVQVEIAGGFRIREGNERTALNPGDEAEIVVIMDTEKLGRAEGVLTVTTLGQQFRVPLRGEVISKATPGEEARSLKGKAFATRDIEGSGPAAPEVDENDPPDGDLSLLGRGYWRSFIAGPKRKRDYKKDVPTVKKVYWKGSTTDEIRAAWDTLGDEYHFGIEIYGMEYDRELEQLVAVWKPYREVTMREKDGKIHIVIFGLEPSTRQAFRVLTINPLGEYSYPSGPVIVRTEAGFKISMRSVFWALVVILSACLAWIHWGRYRERRRGDPGSAEPPGTQSVAGSSLR